MNFLGPAIFKCLKDSLIYTLSHMQGMSCEGACGHAHVRCAVARVHVCAKSILKSVRDVRACG